MATGATRDGSGSFARNETGHRVGEREPSGQLARILIADCMMAEQGEVIAVLLSAVGSRQGSSPRQSANLDPSKTCESVRNKNDSG